MVTVQRDPLATNWNEHLPAGYDVVVIGSGYGGAITAARLTNATWPVEKPSVCILERGREWLPGDFPDNLVDGAGALRSSMNPLGLYDFRIGADVGAWMACGLGGTSLINANVAIEPDDQIFDNPQWPQAIRDALGDGTLRKLFARVRRTLHVGEHPRGGELSKAKALEKGSQGTADANFELCKIAVNFEIEDVNAYGVKQRQCINCGDCISGCNVGAKNTLDTNYLALAKSGGTHIFTQVEVDRIEESAGGGYDVHYTRHLDGTQETGSFHGRNVVVSAGALGSTGILLRSQANGLSVADTLGKRFSTNGDFLAFSYNGDERTDMLGWGAHPETDRARRLQPGPGPTLFPGPSIVARIKYGVSGPLANRMTFEDLSLPLVYVNAARAALVTFFGTDTDPDDFLDNVKEFLRRARDFGAFDPRLEGGALNHTLMYLIMGQDDAGGRVELDDSGESKISWPGAGDEPVFQRETAQAEAHATQLGSTFIENPLWAFSPFRTLLTPHPLGGCPMGETHQTGAVNDLGRVFRQDGTLHAGLFVADGSVVPTAIGVNPFLTISALTERIAESLIVGLGGVPEADPA